MPNANYTHAANFYSFLRREVVEGNPALDAPAQSLLRAHYPVMLSPQRNPPALAATIYAERRQHPVASICATTDPFVLDAGCGYGSESFLFASLGARVVAVDADPEKIRIAQLRQPYFEQQLQRPLDITFRVADLDHYTPDTPNLSLTWLASVLAAIPHQDAFLVRIRESTRSGGQVMVSDMNLWNPLFLVGEYRRRQHAATTNLAFARVQDFRAMFTRRARVGARYFSQNGSTFDDVQFFQPLSLRTLYQATGWQPAGFYFSGYIPPALARLGMTPLETWLPRVPLISQFGYFYLGVGVK